MAEKGEIKNLSKSIHNSSSISDNLLASLIGVENSNGEGENEFLAVGSVHSPAYRSKHKSNTGIKEGFVKEEPSHLKTEEKKKSNTIKKIKEIDRKLEVKEIAKNWVSQISEDDYVEIFVSGGYFRGGIDAKKHNQIMISNAGLVQSYYESEASGAYTKESKIERSELVALAKWIAENNFFEFEREYTCLDGSNNCQERLNTAPYPVPLKIVVAVGQRRNVVSVPIFAPEMGADYINYPKNLNKIVKAIQDFASL